MCRQNPRRPTQPAGDNPAGRTCGFDFKIISKSRAFRGTTSSIYKSQLMASFSASITGHSHHKRVAGTTSAAATNLQAVVSSAISDAGSQRLAANVPAASGHHAFGALFQTPVTLRKTREAPGDFDRHSDLGGSAPAHQVRHLSPRPRSDHSPDSILDCPRPTREHDLTAVSNSPRNASLARDPRQPPRRHQDPRAEAPRAPTPTTLFKCASKRCVPKSGA